MEIDRRNLLGFGAVAATAGALPAFGQNSPVKPDTVRDRLWAFCNPVNADYRYVEKRSVMTPVESALYLGVPNIIMVNQYPRKDEPRSFDPNNDAFYLPWRSPLELHAFPTRMLKRVVWSNVGASGVTTQEERDEAMALATKTPNFTGLMMDDFIRRGTEPSLTVEQLKDIQKGLKTPQKNLDLFVTLYMASSGPKDQIKPFLAEHLKHIDVLTLWTWHHQDLEFLEKHFQAAERLAPKSRKMLGIYTAAFNPKDDPKANPQKLPLWTPLAVDLMKHQCELGLQWLREGRVEGLILYANFLDLRWECMDWMRDWVRRVGDMPIRPRQ